MSENNGAAPPSEPGQGYVPDPPARHLTHYLCSACGSRFEASVDIASLGSCRNRGCEGRPTKGGW